MHFTSSPQHPDNSIVLHQEDDKNYLLAFRDTAVAVDWLTSLTNMSHKHKRTREIVQKLGEMLYMIPAQHTRKGKVKVSENH
ncbi:protein of unknown function [Georgfuchsia toluolica]|uniref:Uncharacterized protein n=1 Tax=Georgfuchsia toluolica TaxID=424218 RepID=A0A916J868_9PROT|nr:hypothetical protein [Georgfuchsia toluolica]CAG4884181.1 protein of unknown function [Georgfuchsia toluolica]